MHQQPSCAYIYCQEIQDELVFKIFLFKHFVHFLVFGDAIFISCVIIKIIFVCLI
jgi:hypothetical protein